MCKQPDILESEKIHFAVMAIEAGAREMGISPMEMRRRLESRIILLLSTRLEISPERALNLFYETNVCAMLHDSRYGLHLMSDTYIINDVLRELQDRQ